MLAQRTNHSLECIYDTTGFIFRRNYLPMASRSNPAPLLPTLQRSRPTTDLRGSPPALSPAESILVINKLYITAPGGTSNESMRRGLIEAAYLKRVWKVPVDEFFQKFISGGERVIGSWLRIRPVH
jgi:hypothetical protein